MSIPQSVIEEVVHAGLKEDIGDGDITANLLDDDAIAIATVECNETCTICGIDWFEEVYSQLDDQIHIEWNIDDGDSVEANTELCTLSGSAKNLLTGERTALNFIQLLSATATLSAKYAKAIGDCKTKILDTRKTIPGLRLAQKYAVACGGCENHRMGLYDSILIKENHITALGDIHKTVNEARFNNPGVAIVVEVEDIRELESALNANIDRILLDNFSIDRIKEAVNKSKGKIPLEASGGISLENIQDIAKTGVDYISIGALTKNIQAIDMSMRFSL